MHVQKRALRQGGLVICDFSWIPIASSVIKHL
jgi:hypothetical protein